MSILSDRSHNCGNIRRSSLRLFTKREFDPEVFIFRRAELAEFEQLDFFYARMRARYLIKCFNAFRGIVYTLDDDLTKPRVDASLLQLLKKEIDRSFLAPRVFLIILRVAHFIIEQTKIGHVKKPFDLLIPKATRGIKRGVYSF